MVSDDVNRLLERAKLFDRLAALTVDARAQKAALDLAQEYRERAEQLTAATASNGGVEAPGSEEGSAQGTGEGGSVVPES